jgi:uncharacterized protein YbjT (DUF2867 family)
MGKQVLVTGASGFVGAHLAEALETRGYSVLAMTRHPDTYSGAGEPVFGDVYEPASLGSALADVDAAYYLVHSLARHDFVERDAEAARSFGMAAADAGLERLIYLGGLGRDGAELSAHLKSRREVEHLLEASGVPVTVLRAAIIMDTAAFRGRSPGSSSRTFPRWLFPNGRPPVPNPSLCRTLFTIWLRCLSGRRPRDGSLRSADLTC